MENNFNDNVVQFLKQEENMLRDKISKCLQGNNFSMYKNLIQAYEKVVELIRKYDWQLMYSKYKTEDNNGNLVQQVAVWEQNGDESVRNHKVWNVLGDNAKTSNSKDGCYVVLTDIKNDDVYILFNGQRIRLEFDDSTLICKQIADKILQIINKDKNTKIYIAPNVEGVYRTSLYLQQQGFKSYDLCSKLM